MKRSFDLVLFDLGSTLIYFDAPWPEVMAAGYTELFQSLRASGADLPRGRFIADFHERLSAYYRERDTEFIEYTTESVLTRLIAEYIPGGLPQPAVRAALDALYAVTQSHWVLEEDAHDCLSRLREMGYALGLISNAGDSRDVYRLIEKARLTPFFSSVLISAEVGYRKPHPKIFELALAAHRVRADRAVMVGDTLGADVLGARNAGLASIWITRRANTPDNRDHLDTIQPDAQVETLREIPGLLNKWKKKPAG